MTGRALLLASAFVAALVALATEKAGAASWLEKNFYLSGPQYEGKLPPCDYRDALTLIASRFNQKENMYWVTDLRIVNFERIRETAFRPWAANSIPRRFCSGVVEVMRNPQADERSAMLDLRATAFAGLVLILVVIGAVFYELARGHDPSPYSQLGAIAGVAYLVALIALQRRS